MSLLGEPRENSFMKFEFRHNQALQDLARSLNSVGRIRVSSTYPPLCRAKIEPAVSNLQCAIHIDTVDYNGNVRVDGGDPLTVNIWDPYGKLCEYNFHDKQNGAYMLVFRPLISGNHKIDIRIFDRPISGSPFIVDVTKHNNPLWSFGMEVWPKDCFSFRRCFSHVKVNVVAVKMTYPCRWVWSWTKVQKENKCSCSIPEIAESNV
jgi:tripartite motif-containing protein 2/3